MITSPFTREELVVMVEAQAAHISNLEAELSELRRKTDNRKKLTPRDVGLIRRLGRTSGCTHQELADSFEVNRATISRILNGVYHKVAA
ncbi:hypothetical protein ACWDYH_00540 [Nocardia goodfellowii]